MAFGSDQACVFWRRCATDQQEARRRCRDPGRGAKQHQKTTTLPKHHTRHAKHDQAALLLQQLSGAFHGFHRGNFGRFFARASFMVLHLELRKLPDLSKIHFLFYHINVIPHQDPQRSSPHSLSPRGCAICNLASTLDEREPQKRELTFLQVRVRKCRLRVYELNVSSKP